MARLDKTGGWAPPPGEAERRRLRRMYALADRLTGEAWLLAWRLETGAPIRRLATDKETASAQRLRQQALRHGLIVEDVAEHGSIGWRLAEGTV